MSSKNRPKGTAVSNDKTPVQGEPTNEQATGAEGQDENLQSGGDTAGETSGATIAENLAPAASAAPVDTTAKADTDTELSAFQALVAEQRQNGLQSARVVIDTMDGYMQAMKPGLPVSDDEDIQHQITLWRLIQRVLNDENYEAMAAGLDMLIAYFKEYRKTALAEIYVFRGAELLTLAAEQAQAFHAALNVLHIAAGTGVKSVQKHADLNRSFTEQVYSDTARNNIQAYFLA